MGIEVLYITQDTICFTCNACNTEETNEQTVCFDIDEAHQDWYQFTCKACDTKRKVNLRHFLGLKERMVEK